MWVLASCDTGKEVIPYLKNILYLRSIHYYVGGHLEVVLYFYLNYVGMWVLASDKVILRLYLRSILYSSI